MSSVPWSLLPDTAEEGPAGELLIGGCSTLDLAARFGTPLFVYDEAHLRDALSPGERRLRRRCGLRQQGVPLSGDGPAGSRGTDEDRCRDRRRAVRRPQAGVPGRSTGLHGNNKSEGEIEQAAAAGVGRLVIDSFDEFARIRRVHDRTGHVFDVLLRITPGIEAHTHHYVATGQDDSKFGFTLSTGAAAAAIVAARSHPGIRLQGIHLHIGSQVFLVDSFAAALAAVGGFVKSHGLDELSMGGGLGVAYVEGEEAPSIADYARILKTAASEAGITAALSVEPGRAIVAGAAVTLYTVGTIKEIPGVRTYVAVDGGMSDNPRPVLYGSGYETFLPRAVNADRSIRVRVVGKHCESGDVLVREGSVPDDLMVGDLLATPVTGAYGHSMGSNYNKVPRPAVVFVADGEARLVVARETYEDLVRNDR